ncbi:TPA: hypothetical protein ACGO51_001208, partial [Streptococcus suis]
QLSINRLQSQKDCKINVLAFDDNYSICQQSIKNVLKNVLKNALGMLKTSGQGLFLSAKTAIFKNVRDKSKYFSIKF